MGFERMRKLVAAVGITAAASGEMSRPAQAMDVQATTETVEKAAINPELQQFIVEKIGLDTKNFVAFLKDPDAPLTFASAAIEVRDSNDAGYTKADIDRWLFNPEGFANRNGSDSGAVAAAMLWTPEEWSEMQVAGGMVPRAKIDIGLVRMRTQEAGLPFYVADTSGILAEMRRRESQGTSDIDSPFTAPDDYTEPERRAFTLPIIEGIGFTGPLLHMLQKEQQGVVDRPAVVEAAYTQTTVYVDYLTKIVEKRSTDSELSYQEYRELVQRVAALSIFIPEAGLVDNGYDDFPQLADLKKNLFNIDVKKGSILTQAVAKLWEGVLALKTKVTPSDRQQYMQGHKPTLEAQKEDLRRRLESFSGQKITADQKHGIEATITPDIK